MWKGGDVFIFDGHYGGTGDLSTTPPLPVASRRYYISCEGGEENVFVLIRMGGENIYKKCTIWKIFYMLIKGFCYYFPQRRTSKTYLGGWCSGKVPWVDIFFECCWCCFLFLFWFFVSLVDGMEGEYFERKIMFLIIFNTTTAFLIFHR